MNKLLLVCVAFACFACTEVYKSDAIPADVNVDVDINVHVEWVDGGAFEEETTIDNSVVVFPGASEEDVPSIEPSDAGVEMDEPDAEMSDEEDGGSQDLCTKERRLHDRDGDEYGDPEDYIFVCVSTPWEEGFVNWIEGNDDCDDNDPTIQACEEPCVPRIEMFYVTHNVGTVYPGSDDATTYFYTLIARCSDHEVTAMDFDLYVHGAEAEDETPFRHGSADDPEAWNFRDLKVKDAVTGAIVAGPLDHPTPNVNNQSVHLSFNDTFVLEQDVSRTFAVTFDVPETFQVASEEAGYTVVPVSISASVPVGVTLIAAPTQWPWLTVNEGQTN